MCTEHIEMDIVVPSQTHYLRFIGEIGEKVAAEWERYTGDREALAYSLNLVLTEAMVNAIEHGRNAAPNPTIHVAIRVLPDQLWIRVYDHGQGFDLESVPPPHLEPPSERGRGIFLIKSLMDSVRYQKVDDGNVLEMRKMIK